MKRYLFATSAVLATVFGLVSSPTSWAKPADLPSHNQIECPDGSDDPVQGKFSIEVDLFARRVSFKVETSGAKPNGPTNIDTVCTPLVPVYLQHLLKLANDVLAPPPGAQAPIDGTSKKGKTLETRLFEPVNLRIKEVPFQQAIKNLGLSSGVPMVPDYRAMKDAKVNLDQPVSLVLEGTSVHTALQQLLKQMRLTYVIDNDMVKITTPEKMPWAEAKVEQAQRFFETAERCRRAGEYESARVCFQQAHLLSPTSLFGRVAIVRLQEIEERLRDAAEESGVPGQSDDAEQTYRDLLDRSVPLGLVRQSY